MKAWKKLMVTATAAVMAVGSLGALTACGGNGGPTHFSIWIPQGESSEYYGTDYAKNPVVQYLESKTWEVDGEQKKISFEWEVPADDPTGSLSRKITTRTYADVLDASSASSIMSVRSMYEEGMILDLTEYVEKYMPNYMAFLDANPALAKTATNLMSDGSKKHLQIWAYQGNDEVMWGGWLYRRDWIAKYGKNPSTGAAFTSQGWTEKAANGRNDNWVDDVMFPSWYSLDSKGNAMKGPNGEEFKDWYHTIDAEWDGSAPVTISDWEWMLQILEDAISAQNIANGYVMGMYYPGYYEVGDLACSFGGGGPTWYLSENKTKANFGMTGEGFHEYLKVMNSWYKEGWINKSFNESNKIFYEADATDAALGRVGLWWGQNGQMADRIEDPNTPATVGACAYGARQPINTTYGSAEVRYKVPTLMYQTGQEMRSFVITNKAANKDIPLLLTMMDSMYTEEGAVLQGYGLNKEQYEEYKAATGKTISEMEQFADEEGRVIYFDEDNLVQYSTKVTSDQQEDMLRGSRLWGYCPRWRLHAKRTYPKTTRAVTSEWTAYRMTGDITNSLLAQLDPDKGDEFAKIKTDLRSWGEQNIYRYVKGEFDPNNDSNWNTLVRRVNNLKVDDATKILQDVLDKLYNN